ncbi:hypothetical protein GCM10023183_25520 [Nibribacter koreensis]|uniref:Uncharacterized protein n=1 Tax=Nibribacter koreensis TaxID=1084519 RepID=A0ABP8FQI5_9BACT
MPFVALLPLSARGRGAPSSRLALYQLASFAWFLLWLLNLLCSVVTADRFRGGNLLRRLAGKTGYRASSKGFYSAQIPP